MHKFVGPGVTIGGIVLLAAALITFLVGVPIIIDNKVKEETRLETNSSTFLKWRDVKVPVYLKLKFFNITNPDAIEKGEKYHLTEHGPYVWEERRQKEIVAINENDDTISYREYITYHFNQKMSSGSQEDTINMLNFPLVAVSTILKKTLFGFANIPINILMNDLGEKFVRNVKIREVMFDGIEIDPFYNTLVSLSPGGPPEEFSGGKFAFYKTKNGSHDGVYQIKRGIDDHKTFGNVISWEGKKELDWWTDKKLAPFDEQYCNKINGSDGSVFPPFVETDRVMRIFVLDICRSIYLNYHQDIEYQGIKGYQFRVPSFMFAHPEVNKDNQCFCTNPGGELAKHCAGGIIRIFSCKSDAPIMVSNPHFLDATPDIKDDVDGLKPDPEIHGTQIEVEPKSGLLLQARKRIQFNAELQPLVGIPAFNDVPSPSVAVPLFWAEEHAAISTEDTDDLKGKLINPLKTVKIVQWTVVAVLAVVTLGGGFLTFRQFRSS